MPDVRAAKRGIPAWFLDLLVEHGKGVHDGHDAVLKTVTKATRRRLQNVLSPKDYARAERWFGVYVVLTSEDAVITAGGPPPAPAIPLTAHAP